MCYYFSVSNSNSEFSAHKAYVGVAAGAWR